LQRRRLGRDSKNAARARTLHGSSCLVRQCIVLAAAGAERCARAERGASGSVRAGAEPQRSVATRAGCKRRKRRAQQHRGHRTRARRWARPSRAHGGCQQGRKRLSANPPRCLGYYTSSGLDQAPATISARRRQRLAHGRCCAEL
jgi:hypothetical protein